MVYEQLIAFFGADLSQLKSAETQVNKIIDSIEDRFKNLKLAIKTEVETVKKGSGSSDPSMARALREIEQYKNAQIKAENEITQHVKKQAESQHQARTKQIQRSLAEYQKVLQKAKTPSGGGGGNAGGDFFSTLLGNSRLGGIALAGSVAGGAAAGILLAVDALKAFTSVAYDAGRAAIVAGSNFEKIENSLTAILGSSQMAKSELKAIDEVARNTTGLRLEASEQGFQRLRAVQFEAARARSIIKELGEEKILSGASDDSVKAVLFNFTQIASGGQKIGQELREILTQLPSLKTAFIDAFGTLSGAKIQSQLESLGTDAFFDKLLGSLAKNKTAVGGVEDAYGKLIDELIIAGRELSMPMLPDATQDLKDLSKYLRDNEETWKTWGQNVKTVYGDVAAFIKDTKNVVNFIGAPTILETAGNIVLPGSGTATKLYLENVSSRSKPQQEDVSKLAQKMLKEQNDAANIMIANELLKQEQLAEQAREKELSQIKVFHDEKLSILKSYYDVATAITDSGLNLTTQQEINSIKKLSALKSTQLRSEIGTQTDFFNKQIELNEGNLIEQQKLSLEKNQVIRKLNADLKINEINTQKQIAQAERQILEKRRSDAIQFKQLQSRELALSADSTSFDLSRNISFGVNAQQSFEQLKNLTFTNFQQIREITVQSQEIQLQNERLTDEERLNLKKQFYLELKDLAEENRRNILDIDDRLFDDQIRRFDEFTNRQVSSISSGASLLGQLNFANKGSVLSLMTSQFFEKDPDAMIAELKVSLKQAGDLYAQLAAVQEKAGAGNKTKAQGDLINQFNLMVDLKTRLNQLEFPETGLRKQLIDLTRLGKQFDEGKISVENYDDAQRLLLKTTQDYGLFGLETQRDALKTKIERFKNSGRELEAIAAQSQLDAVNNQIDSTKLQNSNQLLEQQKQSVEGLKEAFKSIGSGTNIDFSVAIEKEAWTEKINLISQIKTLEAGYYKDTEYLALQKNLAIEQSEKEIFSLKDQIANFSDFQNLEIEKALLQDIIALRQAETQQIIEGNRTMNYRLQLMQVSLPSAATSLRDAFQTGLQGVGDIFSSALTQWDGSLKGFFKSVGLGFADLMRQIATELIRVAIIKGIVGLVGNLFGGGFGGGGSSSIPFMAATPPAIGMPAGGAAAGFSSFFGGAFAGGGTPPMGKISLIGEEGPELFIPNTRGTVINNRDTERILNNSGKGNTVVNNYNSVNQTIHAPRGIVYPKTARQAGEAAMGGLQKSSK